MQLICNLGESHGKVCSRLESEGKNKNNNASLPAFLSQDR